MRQTFPFLALCLSLLPACSGTDQARSGVASLYPRDSELRMNQIQLLATHNSYHVETPGNAIPQWHYTHDPLDTQLVAEGVRGLELDTHYDDGAMNVYHVQGVDYVSVCSTLADCLAIVKTWSDAHPSHHPLFIQIEPKETSLNMTVDFAAYADAMDATILSVWPRDRIIAPADIQGSAATLRDAVTSTGWPTLGETRGKVLFYINERLDFHTAYTRGGSDISGRIAFPESHADEPISAILIPNDPTDTSIAGKVQQGFIARVMVDEVPINTDYEARRDAGLASGAQILSTDYPVSGDTGVPAFAVPDGTPSRCNVVNAPTDCTSHDVENPAALSAQP